MLAPPLRVPFALALATLSLLAPSCGGSGGSTPGVNAAGARLSGAIVVLAQSSTTLEAEPNDTVEQAHELGALEPGAVRTVLGSITDSGTDPFDGFRFTASDALIVELELTGETAGADLDVYVADPVSLQFVERFETPAVSETGTFVARGTFFVVVRAFSGTSPYTLTVTASAAPAEIAEREPNGTNASAQYLGVLELGQRVTVEGTLGVTDIADRFLVALPDGGPLTLSLTHGGSNDFDLRVYDATTDLLSPSLVATLDSPTSPEAGEVLLPAMTLAQVEVYPFSGAGEWELTLLAGPGPVLRDSGGAPPPASLTTALSVRARGSADAEARRLRGGARGAPFASPQTELWPGALIVTPRTGAPNARAALDGALARRAGGVVAAVPDGPQLVRFELPPALDDAQRARYTVALAASLAGHADVVEPDWVHRPSARPDTRPNDTHYNLQWHYEQLQLPAAWDLERGDPAITVAVLDTGSTPHPDLVAREVPGIDMISNPQIAGDGDGIDNDPFDVGDSNGLQPSSFHGSHVAGTIGASTNDGRGVAGVTWAGRVMHVRVLGIGGGSTFDILNGVRFAAGLPNASGMFPIQRADVINMSLGGPGSSASFQDAIDDARAAGVVIVAAAGNENSAQPSYPAAYAGVVSVAAVDFEARRAPYSNFHPSVDLAAPGGDVTRDRNGDGYADGVLSTKPDDTATPTNYSSYSFYQGTSMAAPHVAGVAALVLSVDPMLTPGQVEALLASTATDLGTPGRDNIYGEGLVNAFGAVQAAGGGGGGVPPVLSLGSPSLLFGVREDATRVGIANVGGGALVVQSATAVTSSGGSWLDAALVASPQGGPSSASGVDVTVSATGLPDGVYAGSVTVQSNGGTAVLDVLLALGTSTTPIAYTVYVLAVDAFTYETIAEREVRTDGATEFSFAGLPPGAYLLVAGTDEDGDFVICDPGEPLCGVYPTLEQPAVLTVLEGDELSGLDLVVQEAFLPAAAATGFTRRRPGPVAAPATELR